jgi:nicotinamide riboside kinase
MLIGFIGTPCSGKTTIAAKLFASLKEIGMKTEIVAEQARQYIAEVRYTNHMKYNDPVSLTNDDQLNIYKAQMHAESIMMNSTAPETIIISDSSCLNAGLYLDSTFDLNPDRGFFTKADNHYDILFFCHNLNLRFLPEDSNRIHSLDDINGLQDRALKLLDICKQRGQNVFELYGTLTLEQRYLKASHVIMEYHGNFIQSL